MPFGNGTGPFGAGPMTGRGAGFCAGYSVPGYMNPYPGRGFGGRGFGRGGGGRGFRNRFWATGLTGWQRAYSGPRYAPGPGGYPGYEPGAYSKQDHMNDLKAQADHLEGLLEDIKKEIASLEADTQE